MTLEADKQIKQMNYRWQMIKTLQLGLAGEHLDGRARQRLLGSAKGGNLCKIMKIKNGCLVLQGRERGESSGDNEDKTTNT